MSGPRLVLLGLMGLAMTAVAGCAASSGGTAATDASPSDYAIVMTSAQQGYAVLPSGSRWVLVGTRDGWRTVVNLTPTSVPTDGGLALGASGDDVVLGVLPHELLSVSPVFTSVDGGRRWSPGQLPGGLAAGKTLSASAQATLALLARDNGTVVAATRARGPWAPLVSPSTLNTTAPLDSVTSFQPREIVVTARGSADQALLFSSTNAGRSWRGTVLPAPHEGLTRVFPPCHIAGGGWLVPVMSGGQLWVAQGRDLAGPWQHGPPVATGGSPVTACGTASLWVYSDDEPKTLRVAGLDGWSASVPLREAPTALSVIGAGRAVATVAGASHLVAIALLPDPVETPVSLPGWVATVGGGDMGI